MRSTLISRHVLVSRPGGLYNPQPLKRHHESRVPGPIEADLQVRRDQDVWPRTGRPIQRALINSARSTVSDEIHEIELRLLRIEFQSGLWDRLLISGRHAASGICEAVA